MSWSSAITVVSPPIGADAVAITVSEPPSTMLRAAASALRAAYWVEAVERVDQDDGVGAAGRDPAGLIDDQLDDVVLGVGGGREADGGGRRSRVAPLGDLLGADAGEHDGQLELARRQRASEPGGGASPSCRTARDRRSSRASRGRTGSAARSPRVSDPPSRTRSGSLGNAAGRSSKRALSASSIGGAIVDRVDPDQRGEPLRAPRRAARPGHPVAGDELAALDLSRGDVDVVVRGVGRTPRGRSPTRWEAARRCRRRSRPRLGPRLGSVLDSLAASSASSCSSAPDAGASPNSGRARRGVRDGASTAPPRRVLLVAALLGVGPRRRSCDGRRHRRRSAAPRRSAWRRSRRSARAGATDGNRRSRAPRRSRVGRRAGLLRARLRSSTDM